MLTLKASAYDILTNHGCDLALHGDRKRRARDIVPRFGFVDAGFASEFVFWVSGVLWIFAAPREALGYVAFVGSSFARGIDLSGSAVLAP
jgi:hypothetical protein